MTNNVDRRHAVIMAEARAQGVIDHATRSIFSGHYEGGASDQEAQAEIMATLTELAQSFGLDAIRRAIAAIAPNAEPDQEAGERLLRFARSYSILILESERPKLVASLVGKLARMEIGTGARIDLNELGRRHNLTKQAVCRLMRIYSERLNLPRPDSNPTARESARFMNWRNYAK